MLQQERKWRPFTADYKTNSRKGRPGTLGGFEEQLSTPYYLFNTQLYYRNRLEHLNFYLPSCSFKIVHRNFQSHSKSYNSL